MTHTNIAFCEGAKQILLTQEESALDSAKKQHFPQTHYSLQQKVREYHGYGHPEPASQTNERPVCFFSWVSIVYFLNFSTFVKSLPNKPKLFIYEKQTLSLFLCLGGSGLRFLQSIDH